MPESQSYKPLDENARILVTGGAGFIGSSLIHTLNQRGINDILICDILGSDEKWKNLVPLQFDDYLEFETLDTVLASSPEGLGHFDYIFHLGACSATTEKNASYLIENNYAFTRDLSALALGMGARFVYASSAATYGDGTQGMVDDESAIESLRPLNMYGYSKQLFDLHAKRQGDLAHIVGVKYFNVFGPNEFHKAEMRSLVCKAFEQIQESGRLKLFKSHRPDFKDGEQMRDFVYVKDAVEMTLHLAETPAANGLFNIGSGLPRTWLDLGRAIFTALDRKPQIDFIDMPEQLRSQYQYYTEADMKKFLSTGFDKSLHSLEDAVSDYVKNYLLPHKHLGE
ncbi:MAG: ADP-glyceromanno-heptose 6-epimerase [Chthoniobacterales bacterium]